MLMLLIFPERSFACLDLRSFRIVRTEALLNGSKKEGSDHFWSYARKVIYTW